MAIFSDARYARACPSCGTADGLELMQVTRDALSMVEEWDFRCACGRVATFCTPYQNAGPVLPEPPRDPPPAPESIPTIRGSVIGYRAWRIQDWRLTGTYSPEPWVPGVNEARCAPPGNTLSGLLSSYGRPRHPAPALGCACGITALARFTRSDRHWETADVFGAIEAWSDEEEDGDGRFILHRNGFRAQFAKVVLLAVDADWPAAKRAAVRALAQEHGADVCKRDHLEDAAQEHGQLVPDDLLAWAGEGDPSMEGNPYPYTLHGGGYARGGVVRAPGFWQSPPHPNVYGLISSAAPQPKRSKGIKQTLGHPGPPSHGKWRESDRVRDSKGVIGQCTKGGRPGIWAVES